MLMVAPKTACLALRIGEVVRIWIDLVIAWREAGDKSWVEYCSGRFLFKPGCRVGHEDGKNEGQLESPLLTAV